MLNLKTRRKSIYLIKILNDTGAVQAEGHTQKAEVIRKQ